MMRWYARAYVHHRLGRERLPKSLTSASLITDMEEQMSIKTTRRITRQQALEILLSKIPELPNDALGELMDRLADTRQSKRISVFDNFIVSEFMDDEKDQHGQR